MEPLWQHNPRKVGRMATKPVERDTAWYLAQGPLSETPYLAQGVALNEIPYLAQGVARILIKDLERDTISQSTVWARHRDWAAAGCPPMEIKNVKCFISAAP